MVKVSNEELSKISQFIACCNDMINGKFILADIKISKILKMIADSEELYGYITECMRDFDFSKELHRAELKNSLNNGSFSAPTDQQKLVALVFSLLVEFDAKRMDFYTFINENFLSKDRAEVYVKFAKTLLVPFRDIIAGHFGLADASNEEVKRMTQNYAQDLQQDSPFAEQNVQYDSDRIQSIAEAQDSNVFYQYGKQDFTTMQTKSAKTKMGATTMQTESAMQKLDTWQKIAEICDNVEDSIKAKKHINSYLRDELLYINQSIKYSTKYKDKQITSALVTAFDEMSKKFRQIQFVFGELKTELQRLYL